MNKNCIISTIAKPSLHRRWLRDGRIYDCYFTTYRKTDFCIYELDGELVIYSETPEPFINHFEMLQRIASKPYEYYFFIDCNLDITSEQINQLFQFMKEYNLEGCMPALSLNNYLFPEHISRNNSKLHFVNYLDTRCVIFSHQALSEILTTFKTKEISGIEAEWFKLLGSPTNKLAVIDIVEAELKDNNGINIETYEKLLKSDTYKPYCFGFIDLENNISMESRKKRLNPNPSIERLKKKTKKVINPFNEVSV